MDTRLIQQIRQAMNAKPTDELIEIYRQHNEEEYSAETFEVIRQVLRTRGEPIPAIDPPAGRAMRAIHEVVVTDVQMPFVSIVVFMVKWALAAIPAIIILAVIWAIALAMFGGIFGAIGRR